MVRKFLYKINRFIGLGPLPIARIINDTKTESYTLLNSGWVIIRSTSKKDKGYDMMPVYLIRRRLAAAFTKQLQRG